MELQLQGGPVRSGLGGLENAAKDVPLGPASVLTLTAPTTTSNTTITRHLAPLRPGRPGEAHVGPREPGVVRQQRVGHQVDGAGAVGVALVQQLGLHEVKPEERERARQRQKE